MIEIKYLLLTFNRNQSVAVSELICNKNNEKIKFKYLKINKNNIVSMKEQLFYRRVPLFTLNLF